MSAVQNLDPVTYPKVTAELLRAYAAASGDHNPIHLDAEVAKKFGLPGIIAHGMLVAGWVSDRAQRFCREQGGGWLTSDLQFRFKSMTLLGDEIVIAGTATPHAELSRAWDLQLTATNPRQEIAVLAQLTVRPAEPVLGLQA